MYDSDWFLYICSTCLFLSIQENAYWLLIQIVAKYTCIYSVRRCFRFGSTYIWLLPCTVVHVCTVICIKITFSCHWTLTDQLLFTYFMSVRWCYISESSCECGEFITHQTARLQAEGRRCTHRSNLHCWPDGCPWPRVCLEGRRLNVTAFFVIFIKSSWSAWQ